MTHAAATRVEIASVCARPFRHMRRNATLTESRSTGDQMNSVVSFVNQLNLFPSGCRLIEVYVFGREKILTMIIIQNAYYKDIRLVFSFYLYKMIIVGKLHNTWSPHFYFLPYE